MKSEIEENFEKLDKKIITYFKNNDESLRGAKELFASSIDSTRSLEKIKNIEQLLEKLKKMKLYSAETFNTFQIFKKIIDDENYLQLLTRHKELLNSCTDTGESVQNKYAIASGRVRFSNDIPFPREKTLRNEILNTIANGISQDVFRRLARHLDFTRQEIMDIELKSNDFRTQNLILLGMYETRRNSLTRLVKVLILIEKPDLVRELTAIMNRTPLT